MSAHDRGMATEGLRLAFYDAEGRKWAYRGKCARVLQMLVCRPQGITQYDCLPWHTRLAGTIHMLRCNGLDITTEIEGPCRHARYRLATNLRLAEDHAEEAYKRKGRSLAA